MCCVVLRLPLPHAPSGSQQEIFLGPRGAVRVASVDGMEVSHHSVARPEAEIAASQPASHLHLQRPSASSLNNGPHDCPQICLEHSRFCRKAPYSDIHPVGISFKAAPASVTDRCADRGEDDGAHRCTDSTV